MRTQVRRAAVTLLALTIGLSVQTLAPAAASRASGSAAVNVNFTIGSAVHKVALNGSLPLQATVQDWTPGCRWAGVGCDTPTGDVEFTLSGPRGTQTLGTSTLIPVAQHHELAQTGLTHAVVTVPAGSYTYKAHYAGDSTFSPNHASIALTVTKGSVTVALAQDSTSTLHGEQVLFTALVGGNAHAPSPTGTITFTDNGHPLGTGTIVPRSSLLSAHATLETSALSNGGHSISASYAGDANYVPASAPAIQHKVIFYINPCALTHCSTSTTPAAVNSSGQGKAAGDGGAGNVPSPPGGSGAGGGGGTGGSDPNSGYGAGNGSNPGSGSANGAGAPDSGEVSGRPSAAGSHDSDLAFPVAATTQSSRGSQGTLWLMTLIILVALIALAVSLWLLLRHRRRPESDPSS